MKPSPKRSEVSAPRKAPAAPRGGSPERHIPVLQKEIVRFLARPDAVLIDATVGDGGHAEALLAASGSEVRLLGVDLDAGALRAARETLARFADRVTLVHGTFADLGRHAAEHGFERPTGVLFDLGLRAGQLEEPRGFSFRDAAPLDMRFDASGEIPLPEPHHPALRRLARARASYTAADVVAHLHEPELADLLWREGGERYARRIARAVVRRRKESSIRTARDLADTILKSLPPPARHGRLHAATRTFQALRIAVNRERESLEQGLAAATGLLAASDRGRLAVVSYHSGEDRIVKDHFRGVARDVFRIVTRRPLLPSLSEIVANPRARSAKLRILEHLPS